MQTITQIGSRMAAACGALALSLVLIGQTVSAPQTAGSLHIASTYVGAVA